MNDITADELNQAQSKPKPIAVDIELEISLVGQRQFAPSYITADAYGTIVYEPVIHETRYQPAEGGSRIEDMRLVNRAGTDITDLLPVTILEQIETDILGDKE